jgi:serine/threonine protein phosphatase PrpC
MVGKVIAAGHSHVGERERNEDSWAIVQFPLGGHRRGEKPPVGTLAIVADGLGGEANGQQGSMAAVRSCQTANMTGWLKTMPPQAALSQMFNVANLAVAQSRGFTTLVAVLALPDQPLYIAWAGDSAVRWWEPRKGWKHLTAPHGEGNMLTNFLGDRSSHRRPPMYVEQTTCVHSGVYLITSDGMDPVLDEGAGTKWAVVRGTSPSTAVHNAVQFPTGHHHDNATCIRLEIR